MHSKFQIVCLFDLPLSPPPYRHWSLISTILRMVTLYLLPSTSLLLNSFGNFRKNKKVLLRERKRHTARRVAIAISCYSGRGVPWQKIFFPVWTCIKPNLVSKNFPFTRGGFSTKKCFFQSEHISSQIWCQKIFPLLGGGGPSKKNLFFQSEHVSCQIWCQKIFPLLGGGSLEKNFFFPVWTCIKPNLVSKIFPLLGGGPLKKKVFFQSEHVSSQIWCQKIFPLLGGGGPLTKIYFSSLNMYQAKSGVKKFSLY